MEGRCRADLQVSEYNKPTPQPKIPAAKPPSPRILNSLPVMSTLNQDKGESSRSAGPSDQSREVHLRQHPAAGPGSTFRTTGIQEETQEMPHPFSEFIDGAGSLPLASTTEPACAEQGAFSDARATDGSAVVDLLSQLDGDDVMPPPDAGLDEDISPGTIQSLRTALFTTENHTHPVSWDNLLNFTPDYVVNPVGGATEAELHFGTSDAQAVGEGWYQQWEQILSAYTDQVWGDLLPLATEARREVDELTQKGTEAEPQVPKALNRLRMILAHIQRSGG